MNTQELETFLIAHPKEVPLIGDLLKTLARVEKAQEKLSCQVNALIKYHKRCSRAADTLEQDLEK